MASKSKSKATLDAAEKELEEVRTCYADLFDDNIEQWFNENGYHAERRRDWTAYTYTMARVEADSTVLEELAVEYRKLKELAATLPGETTADPKDKICRYLIERFALPPETLRSMTADEMKRYLEAEQVARGPHKRRPREPKSKRTPSQFIRQRKPKRRPADQIARGPKSPIVIEGDEVYVCGIHVRLDFTETRPEAIHFLKQLIAKCGVSGTEITKSDANKNGRWDRLKKRLPQATVKHVQAEAGKGYRLMPIADIGTP